MQPSKLQPQLDCGHIARYRNICSHKAEILCKNNWIIVFMKCLCHRGIKFIYTSSIYILFSTFCFSSIFPIDQNMLFPWRTNSCDKTVPLIIQIFNYDSTIFLLLKYDYLHAFLSQNYIHCLYRFKGMPRILRIKRYTSM